MRIAQPGQNAAFIHDVPNGTETGTFLALDLGGTNLRVCEVRLNGDHTFKIRQQKYKVSDTLKKGDAKALFDYIAISVDKFLTEMGTETNPNDKLFLGFTFSFPVQQTALDKGTLITWTKVSLITMAAPLLHALNRVTLSIEGLRGQERRGQRRRPAPTGCARPETHPCQVLRTGQ